MRHILVIWALFCTACGSAISPAMSAFDEGRYPEAVAEFTKLEAESREWSDDRKTRYALYRGLTHLSCGDVRAADRWLSRAKLAWEKNPSLLEPAESGRMLTAWRSMGRMPGELPTRR